MADDQSHSPPHALTVRLGVGLAQGVALYALSHWHAKIALTAFGGLALTALLVPVVALGAYGAARRATVLGWVAAAAAITATLGAYDGFVRHEHTETWVWPPVVALTAATLFILHHLILPADAERRWRASFERYFDKGWEDAVRLALSVAFVAAFWVLIWLGAALFGLIGLDFLRKLIVKPGFYFPATTTVFAIAVHITDIRAGLVRGARTLALGLLSWLLPVLTLITVGFLLALPFTGLAPLWATKSAGGTLLAACAALIVLLNATYQDGERADGPQLVLKWAARVAALALAPLVMVAVYGVALRIGQHGLTPERIYAGACLLIAACYAAGYAWAALAGGPWLKPLEFTNWVTAQVAVAVMLAIFSPIADPMRISVGDQVARLESGRVTPDRFDYKFLRFNSGRWGRGALKQLAARSAGPHAAEIAQAAKGAQQLERPWDDAVLSPTQRARAFRSATPLPQSFLTQVWTGNSDPALGCQNAGSPCEAIVAEVDDTPGPEVTVISRVQRRVFSLRGGSWVQIGTFEGQYCVSDFDTTKRGPARLTPATSRFDLQIGDRRFAFSPTAPCAKSSGSALADDTAGAVTDLAVVKPAPKP